MMNKTTMRNVMKKETAAVFMSCSLPSYFLQTLPRLFFAHIHALLKKMELITTQQSSRKNESESFAISFYSSWFFGCVVW